MRGIVFDIEEPFCDLSEITLHEEQVFLQISTRRIRLPH